MKKANPKLLVLMVGLTVMGTSYGSFKDFLLRRWDNVKDASSAVGQNTKDGLKDGIKEGFKGLISETVKETYKQTFLKYWIIKPMKKYFKWDRSENLALKVNFMHKLTKGLPSLAKSGADKEKIQAVATKLTGQYSEILDKLIELTETKKEDKK